MFEIKKVVNNEMSNICDKMLIKLVKYGGRFDKNIKKNIVTDNYYRNFYNKDDHCLIIGYINNKPVGYLYGYYNDLEILNYHKEATVDALYIEEYYRKKGIGTALLSHFNDWCKEKDIRIVKIRAYQKDEAALNLYTTRGFQTDVYYLKKQIDL